MIIESKTCARKKALVAMAAALALFCILLTLLLTVDRAPIAPDGSVVGLSSLNGAVANVLPFRENFKRLSDICGVLLMMEGLSFAIVAFVILLREKSFLKVPVMYYAIGVLYVSTIAIYFISTAVPVNYRPVILPGELPKISFPSSHVLLSAVISGSAVPTFRTLFKEKPRARLVAETANACLCVFTVFCRTLSGVHWLTDVLSSIFLGFALVMAFIAFLNREKKQ